MIEFSYTFENACVNARIDLTKLDTETELKTQGDATLEGASYGLYAREDIVHPDGKTGVIFEKDAQVATLTTDKDGRAFVENLYLGKYYIKEIVPSEGYLLDATEYDLDCNEEDDTVKTVQRDVTSKEQVKPSGYDHAAAGQVSHFPGRADRVCPFLSGGRTAYHCTDHR